MNLVWITGIVTNYEVGVMLKNETSGHSALCTTIYVWFVFVDGIVFSVWNLCVCFCRLHQDLPEAQPAERREEN